jgi:hypothetical protein
MSSPYQEWLKTSHRGSCDFCCFVGPVHNYAEIKKPYLCYACAHNPEVEMVTNSVEGRAIQQGVSLILESLQQPKKPKKPRASSGPKMPGMVVPVMTVTRRR